jgi:putative restriction endonuclease
MSRGSALRRFDGLSVWGRRGQRAPHKPLLARHALGRCQRGQAEEPSGEAERDFTAVLCELGPTRKADHPERRFWRLQSDRVWPVRAPEGLPRKLGDDVPRGVNVARGHPKGMCSRTALRVRRAAARSGHFAGLPPGRGE